SDIIISERDVEINIKVSSSTLKKFNDGTFLANHVKGIIAPELADVTILDHSLRDGSGPCLMVGDKELLLNGINVLNNCLINLSTSSSLSQQNVLANNPSTQTVKLHITLTKTVGASFDITGKCFVHLTELVEGNLHNGIPLKSQVIDFIGELH